MSYTLSYAVSNDEKCAGNLFQVPPPKAVQDRANFWDIAIEAILKFNNLPNSSPEKKAMLRNKGDKTLSSKAQNGTIVAHIQKISQPESIDVGSKFSRYLKDKCVNTLITALRAFSGVHLEGYNERQNAIIALEQQLLNETIDAATFTSRLFSNPQTLLPNVHQLHSLLNDVRPHIKADLDAICQLHTQLEAALAQYYIPGSPTPTLNRMLSKMLIQLWKIQQGNYTHGKVTYPQPDGSKFVLHSYKRYCHADVCIPTPNETPFTLDYKYSKPQQR